MDRGDIQEREMLALRNVKADLETLVDTSQVDVVTLDGRTEAPVSVN